MKYTNRADLLISAGESIKMQEKSGIIPVVKINGEDIDQISEYYFTHLGHNYEFPLSVLEGKPVFIGDELYCNGIPYQVREFDLIESPIYSWNQPKPKTVMVELLQEDAEAFTTESQTFSEVKKRLDRVEEACRKALETQ